MDFLGACFKSGAVSFMIKVMSENLTENLAEVRKKIITAAEKAGRNSREIKLVAVSKTHPVEVLREAIEAGAEILGENKVQEAVDKIAEVGHEKAEWHLIGHLQKNKARKAVQNFDVIHTLDSIELAERLERICLEENREKLSVLVQIDLADEDSKYGIKEKDLSELVEFLQSCKCLKFNGLMIIPPYFEDAEDVRPYFAKLREIRDKLDSENVFANGFGELSMGMSHDFEIAIAEGATLIRVGTAIFGQREYV
ncbi:MAG: YggS family pyridoxal phosphate-dependent enzyme [Aridibacter sp.]